MNERELAWFMDALPQRRAHLFRPESERALF